MGVIKTFYNVSTRTDTTQYDSSNVLFSRFVEHETENYGTLYVVFKGNKQYKYEDVSYNDYLMFKHGMNEGSSGKSLNVYIVKKYAAEKIEDADADWYLREVSTNTGKEHCYFIHGDYGYSDEIFENYYIPTMEYILEDVDSRFVFSAFDSTGYVTKCIHYLLDTAKIEPSRLKAYCLPSMDYDAYIASVVKDIENLPEGSTLKDLFDKAINETAGDIAYVSADSLKNIYITSHSAYSILSRYFK